MEDFVTNMDVDISAPVQQDTLEHLVPIVSGYFGHLSFLLLFLLLHETLDVRLCVLCHEELKCPFNRNIFGC